MKKPLVLILGLLCLGVTGLLTGALDPDPERNDPPPLPGQYDHFGQPGPHRRLAARRYLNKTQGYLEQAQQVVHDPEFSRLNRAFAKQEQARRYYRQGHYERAISHSSRARGIALNIINHHRSPGPTAPPLSPNYDAEASAVDIRLNR